MLLSYLRQQNSATLIIMWLMGFMFGLIIKTGASRTVKRENALEALHKALMKFLEWRGPISNLFAYFLIMTSQSNDPSNSCAIVTSQYIDFKKLQGKRDVINLVGGQLLGRYHC